MHAKFVKESTDLLVGCGEEVGIIEGIGKGIEVGGKNCWIAVRNFSERH